MKKMYTVLLAVILIGLILFLFWNPSESSMSISINNSCKVPQAPTLVHAKADVASIDLSWMAIPDVTKYTIYINQGKEASKSNNVEKINIAAGTTTTTVTGLVEKSIYGVYITASNECGEGSGVSTLVYTT